MSTADWMRGLKDTLWLRQVVLPGSHDAGVWGTVQPILRTTSLVKKDYVVCQHSDFAHQALAGSRFFDCRVFRRKMTPGVYENRLGHFAREKVKGSEQPSMGGFGGALDAILTQAMDFVLAKTSEFVILRFSHTYHPTECVNQVKQVISSQPKYAGAVYKKSGNLAATAIGELRGKVLMVFDEQFNHHITPTEGILRFKRYTDGLDHIDGLSTCGVFARSLGMSDVHKGAVKGVDRHLEHPSDPSVAHLHFVYWQQTAGIIGEKDVYRSTSQAQGGRAWTGGAHANLQDFATELKQTRTAGGRLPANVISHDFVTAETCSRIIALNF